MKRMFGKTAGFLRRYWREIAYYGCVMLVLGAIAWGAENYRFKKVQPEDIPAPVSAETIQVREEVRFSIPVDMEVCAPFSAQPLWNAELGCWQAHPAVDFACADAVVCAIGGGKVKTLGESGVYGGFIEIEDGDMLIRYCSLLPEEKMEAGKAVEMGERIGTADDSMPGEAHLGSHVHVEAVCEGEIRDVTELAETSD